MKNKFKLGIVSFFIYNILYCPIIYANPITSKTDEGFTQALIDLFDKYKIYLTGIMGILIMTNIIMMIIMFTKLSKSGSNPTERSHIINEILSLFVCLAILGAIPILFTLLYKITQG